MEFQPIGLHHPRIKHLLALQSNQTPNRHQRFVAEGLWAHEVLLDAGTEIDTFLVCPEALRSDIARNAVQPLAARARHSYAVSLKTLQRIGERDQPDGLVSIADMPYVAAGCGADQGVRAGAGRRRDRDSRQPRHPDPHPRRVRAPTYSCSPTGAPG